MDSGEIQAKFKSNIATLVDRFGGIIGPDRIIEDFCEEYDSLCQKAKPALRENVLLLTEKHLGERYRAVKAPHAASPQPYPTLITT